MNRFYIASSFMNKEQVRYVSSKLKEKGYEQTYDWTIHERSTTIEQLSIIGELERQAVLNADFVIVLLPAGKGSHIEMGIALGNGKKIYLYSLDEEVYNFERTSTFYHLPEVEIVVGNLDELIAIVTK